MPEKSDPMPKALKVAEGRSGTPIETSLQRRKTVVIGRSAECDIVIKDSKASRKHCRLTRGESAFVLEDLNSKNGTYVDGRRIKEPVTLRPNQTFKIGDTVFYLAL
ncbi:MAG: FHA domain-containing protein [Verrucomicrobiota bacterium]|jgi:pSer/pThr/pTyr-binding forkhead associated (FHA) protein